MGRAPLLLALPLLAAALVGGHGIGARAHAAPPDVVLGSGDALSGRLRILACGSPESTEIRALRGLVELIERRADLRVPLEILADLPAEAPSPHALVLFVGEPDAHQTARLTAQVRAGPGLVAIVSAEQSTARSFPKTGDTLRGPQARRFVDPTLDADVPAPRVDVDASHRPRLVIASGGDDARMLLGLLRAAILHGGVRHVESAFSGIRRRVVDGRLELDIATALPGEVTLELRRMTGEVLSPAGPLRPLDVEKISDPDSVLVALGFRGEDDLRDEARYWLRDLLPRGRPLATLRGSPSVRVGIPSLFAVSVVDEDGTPLGEVEIDGEFAGRRAVARTDALGSADLRFEAFPTEEIGTRDLRVAFDTGRARGRLDASVQVTARGAVGLLQLGRPVYEPGESVRVRGFVLDAVSRIGLPGRTVRLELREWRSKTVEFRSLATDQHGVVTADLPLPSNSPRRAHEVTMQVDGELLRSKLVEVARLERDAFDARVVLDEPRVEFGGTLRGTIDVSDWTGVGLEGASAELRLLQPWRGESGLVAASEPLRVGPVADGEPLSFALPLVEDAAFATALDVRVFHDDARVERQVGIQVLPSREPDALRLGTIVAPRRVAPGERFQVVYASRRRETVHAELSLAGQLAAHGCAEARDGSAVIELIAPTAMVGPAELIVFAAGARGADERLGRRIVVARPELIVDARTAAPRVRPSGHTTLDVEVRAPDGSSAPALLDVRAFDAARVVPGGAELRDPTQTAGHPADGDRRTRVLDRFRAVEHRVVAHVRSQRVARAFMRGLAGADPATLGSRIAPWGARVHVARIGRTLHARCDRPITHTFPSHSTGPSGSTGRSRPLLQRLDRVIAAAVFPAVEILPEELTRERAAALQRRPGWKVHVVRNFLARHQSPSGALDPAHFHEQCPGAPCGGPGHEGLEIATTGLGLAALLGGGAPIVEDPDAETEPASDHDIGSVLAAARYLQRRQAEDGFIGPRDAPAAVLSHCFAAIGLIDAYGLDATPEMRPAAERAIGALLELQHENGGFAERGEEPNLVLAAWAGGVLQSAKVTRLGEYPDAKARLATWIEARTVAETGIVRVSPKEAQRYAFAPVDCPRTAAALSILARVFAGQDPAEVQAIPLAAAAITADAARVLPEDSAHSVFASTQALWRVGGEPWKRWSAHLRSWLIDAQRRESACTRGSYEPDRHGSGRLLSSIFGIVSLVHYYRYGSVFGTREGQRNLQAGGGGAPVVRERFPAMMLEELALATDANGRRRVPLDTPDQITTWHLDVGAWDTSGRYGRTRLDLVATLPLHANPLLPRHLFAGDEAWVPVRVRASDGAGLSVKLAVEEATGLTVLSPRAQEVTLDGTGFATAYVHLRADDDVRTARLVLRVSGGGHTDRVAVGCELETPLVPFHAAVTGLPNQAALRLDTGTARGLRAILRVHASALGEAETGVAALIRRPTGCCEQTAATLQPAVLAYRLLQQRDGLDESAAAQAREEIANGVALLMRFHTGTGGFSLYRGDPPQTGLTALALHTLADAAHVVPVREPVLFRAATYLQRDVRRDGAPGIVALAAIRRVVPGAGDTLPPLRGSWLEDPHVLALAIVHGLVPGKHADRLVSSAVVRSDGAEHWQSTSSSLYHDGSPGTVETTGLVVTALQKVGGHDEHVARGIAFLRSQVRADGGWATTRDTVEALRGFAPAGGARPVRGTLLLSAEGMETRTLALDGSARAHEIDLGAWSATAELAAEFAGTGQPTLQLVVRGSTDQPVGPKGPLVVRRTWRADDRKTPHLRAGEGVTLLLEIANGTRERVRAPLVDLPIPAGLRLDRRELRRIAASGEVAHAEIQAGRLHLYLRDVARLHTVELRVELLAVTPGTFHTGAAVVYPYYDPDRESVETGGLVVIERR